MARPYLSSLSLREREAREMRFANFWRPSLCAGSVESLGRGEV